MKNPPSYSIASVDNALRLAAMLQVEGPMRVSDAAERLGVARSTAHRLLQMLVYRDFAAQLSDQRYVAGPMLASGTTPRGGVAQLRSRVLPHLRELAATTGETANLVVLLGTQARFVASVESGQALRIGDREGTVFPAYLTSGGRAILAEQAPEERMQLLRRVSAAQEQAGGRPVDPIAVEADLERVQRLGYAINDQETERGVTAIGMVIRGPGTEGGAAITVAMPTQRFEGPQLPRLVRAMHATVSMIHASLFRAELAAAGVTDVGAVEVEPIESGRTTDDRGEPDYR